MKLKIRDVAKLDSAELALDGITVVAGNNNTGKSTIGKVLFALFDAFNGLEGKARERRAESLAMAAARALAPYSPPSLDAGPGLRRKVRGEVDRFLAGGGSDAGELAGGVLSLARAEAGMAGGLPRGAGERLREEFAARLGIPVGEIRQRLVEETFRRVFRRQFAPVQKGGWETEASASLDSGGEVRVREAAGRFSAEAAGPVARAARYVEMPQVLDLLGRPPPSRAAGARPGPAEGNAMAENLLRAIQERSSESPDIPYRISVEKSLQAVMGKLGAVLPGTIRDDPERGFVLDSGRYAEPLSLTNLSTGLKSFAVLRLLLESGALERNDILILDEPEIHLHPGWQIVYAEIIVLLQKEFGLTVLLTSHSPDFLEAIRLFSRKHGIAGRVNAYITEEDGNGRARAVPVPGDDWDALFSRFLAPYRALRDLRDGLGGEGG